jgi:metallo-beta-lactamase family protein
MKLQFFGAVDGTTGSMHLLHVNGTSILLDCGLHQGHRKEAFERNRNFPIDVGDVDVAVLSHAHIDHSGNLPTLVRAGYEEPIYATPPTVDLCEIMLSDSAYLQEQDVRYVNKKRIRQGKVPFEPLYTQEDVPPVLRAFEPYPYGRPVEIADGVELTFHDAGHILGSAFVQLDITENGSTRRVFFTGDIGRDEQPILKDPVVLEDVDVLITESTYGDRLHPATEDVKSRLAALCRRTCENQSRLVIPAFSVGRTQQVVYFLNELHNEGRIEDLPVYVDSPLSRKATEVHQKHPEAYDAETIRLLQEGNNPFWFPGLRFVQDVEESKKLNDNRGPVVIISASGMCEGGRILHHLKNTVEDERNTILIVGYQAQHTLGRRIVEEVSPIKIFGDEYELRAEVHRINALSAHADRDEMLDYFERMGPDSVQHAFVVHGDPEAAEAFADALQKQGMGNVRRPDLAAEYEV